MSEVVTCCLRCQTPDADVTPTGVCRGCDATPPPAAWPDAPPGIKLVCPVGGGMGLVFRGWDLDGDRPVAVKYLGVRTDAAAHRRFAREVQALADLDHPHVVRVLASDLDARDPYFVMPWVPGGSLSRFRKEGVRLPPADVARVVETVARAVAAAHAAGVLHRDLKPGNVLVGADGEPLMADFGLTRGTAGERTLTGSGDRLGTPGYLSPEQAAPWPDRIDERTDVFGLGGILYELLAGTPPFPASNAVEAAGRMLGGPAPSPRAANAAVPAALDAICRKCLARDPAGRYASAADLADDLNRFRKGERVRAGVRRRWRAAALASVGLTVLPLAAVIPLGGGADRPAHGEVTAGVLTYQTARDILARGGRVTLVSDAGLRVDPVWWTDPSVTDPPAGLPGVGLKGRPIAGLQLLDDPGLDSYRVRAEIMHVDRESGANSPPVPGEWVGLVVGYARPATGLPETVHAVTAAEFAEPPAGVTPYPLLLAHRVVFERTLGVGSKAQVQSLAVPLGAVGGPVWRAFEVDVRPTGLTLRSDNGEVRILPMSELRRHRRLLANDLTILRAGLPPVPDWHPRQPIGLWATRSWAVARRVTIEPIPE